MSDENGVVFNNTGYAAIKPDKDSKGQLDFTKFIDVLNKYQNEALDYLYDVEPQSNNLFWAGYFEQGDNVRPLFNAQYRIRKITIPLPSMTIDNHRETRYPIFKDVNFSQEIKIDWFEDVYHSIKKYHLDWFSRWYNREYDVLRCGVNGKFRTMKVVAYHYEDWNNNVIAAPRPVPIMSFDIGGMIPLSIGNETTFSHDSDENDKFISMTYKCGRILWNYSRDFGFGQEVDATLFSKSASGFENSLWSPEADSSNQVTDKQNFTSPEQTRVARSLTSHIVSEGSL